MTEDNTLLEIKNAEKRAEMKVNKAKEDAIKIVKEAKEKAYKMKENTDLELERIRSEALEKASKDAEKVRAGLIKKNKEIVSSLRKKLSARIQREAEFLVDRFIEGI